jgi:hypothetical protein
MRQYKLHEETKEIQQFSNMNKHDLPNSKRTLIPSYQPINNQEIINHKAFSYYSNKFNTNSVGPDFIPNEEPQIKMQRKSAAQILEESSQPVNIRQLKPNILHKKYVESSQINNIPGPEIMKRYETNNDSNKNENKYSNNTFNRLNNRNKNNARKNSYECRKTDIESFQRKVFRDYNSNIACLPGVTINEREKKRSLVATNSRKNESHISFGFDNDNTNNNKYFNKYDYYKPSDNCNNKKNNIPRPASCSGKRIYRDRNRESNNGRYEPSYKSNYNRINIVKNYFDNEGGLNNNYKNSKYTVNKNKSQIIFG